MTLRPPRVNSSKVHESALDYEMILSRLGPAGRAPGEEASPA